MFGKVGRKLKLSPCTHAGCTPTLLEERDEGQFTYNRGCSMVLAALGNESWSGGWGLEEQQMEELLHLIESCNEERCGKGELTPGATDAKLTLQELQFFLETETNRDHVRALPASAHGLLKDGVLEEGFRKFDEDETEDLDKLEWSSFLGRMGQLELDSLLADSFIGFRAFYGRGQPFGVELELHAGSVRLGHDKTLDVTEAEALKTAAGATYVDPNDAGTGTSPMSGRPLLRPQFQVGVDPDQRPGSACYQVFPLGWWDDFKYYSANNHPLHAIFACDAKHPVWWMERLAIEIATIGFTGVSKTLYKKWVVEGKAPLQVLSDGRVFSLVVVTLGGMVVWWTLFLLFTAPCACARVNKARASKSEIAQAKSKQYAVEAIGWVLVILGMGCFALSFRWKIMRHLLVARLKSYIIFWFLMFFVYFNPLVAWGQTDPNGSLKIGDLIGLGQWRIEKQRFQALCVYSLQRHLEAAHNAEEHLGQAPSQRIDAAPKCVLM